MNDFGFNKNAIFSKKFWLFLMIITVISVMSFGWQVINFIKKYHLRGKNIVRFKGLRYS